VEAVVVAWRGGDVDVPPAAAASPLLVVADVVELAMILNPFMGTANTVADACNVVTVESGNMVLSDMVVVYAYANVCPLVRSDVHCEG
jgi:hypothetical protein